MEPILNMLEKQLLLKCLPLHQRSPPPRTIQRRIRPLKVLQSIFSFRKTNPSSNLKTSRMVMEPILLLLDRQLLLKCLSILRSFHPFQTTERGIRPLKVLQSIPSFRKTNPSSSRKTSRMVMEPMLLLLNRQFLLRLPILRSFRPFQTTERGIRPLKVLQLIPSSWTTKPRMPHLRRYIHLRRPNRRMEIMNISRLKKNRTLTTGHQRTYVQTGRICGTGATPPNQHPRIETRHWDREGYKILQNWVRFDILHLALSNGTLMPFELVR